MNHPSASSSLVTFIYLDLKIFRSKLHIFCRWNLLISFFGLDFWWIKTMRSVIYPKLSLELIQSWFRMLFLFFNKNYQSLEASRMQNWLQVQVAFLTWNCFKHQLQVVYLLSSNRLRQRYPFLSQRHLIEPSSRCDNHTFKDVLMKKSENRRRFWWLIPFWNIDHNWRICSKSFS